MLACYPNVSLTCSSFTSCFLFYSIFTACTYCVVVWSSFCVPSLFSRTLSCYWYLCVVKMESRAKATWSLTQLNNQTQPIKNCGALNRCAQVQKTDAMATSANESTAITKLFPIVTMSILCLFGFGSTVTPHLFDRFVFSLFLLCFKVVRTPLTVTKVKRSRR